MRRFYLFLSVIIGFILIVFSYSILNNYIGANSCFDCTYERNILGQSYNGWTQIGESCQQFQFTNISAAACINLLLKTNLTAHNISTDVIKTPNRQILNTVTSSDIIEVYKTDSVNTCQTKYAVSKNGTIYTTGGCLG